MSRWHPPALLRTETRVRCGASRVTVDRSLPGEIAAYGRDISHHAFYWGAELMLITTAEGRILALNAAIWHNRLINAPVKRALIAYDH
ncbi:hypothetical protein [Actinoallomurus sp. CA-142502]|uniref:hypothetical protein n=1 Tax=Actinoallomurus sp. CA-142502 TaxID=3239885 RepID=UPI003D8F12FB